MKLEIQNLTVDRGTRRVLDQLSFSVSSGEAVILAGPNGAGKTTLIRTVAGFIRPASGSVRLDGGDDERDLAAQCHYVGHANGIKSSLTVEENLRFWADYLGHGEQGIDDAMDAFDVVALATMPVAYLSAGQKRRVGLARLLVAERPIWLLDEPSVSLDTASTALLASVVDRHVKSGGIAIAATHVPLGLGAAWTLDLSPQRGPTA